MNFAKKRIFFETLKYIPYILMPLIVIINIILFYETLFISASEAFDMIYKTVICIIFPYMITAELLSGFPVYKILPGGFKCLYEKIYGVTSNTAAALIMGNICGYPVGAKMLFSSYERGSLSKNEVEKMLPYVTNSSIGFLIGTIGTVLLENTFAGFVIYLIQILSSLICALLSKKSKIFCEHNMQTNTNINIGRLIANATQNTVLIAGTVLCFNLFITMLINIFSLVKFLSPAHNTIKLMLASALEITNGVICAKNTLSGFGLFLALNIINCFSGLSVAMQIKMISPDAKISLKPYFWVKLKQTIIGSFLAVCTYLLIG